jgi:hypothetical protein
VANEWKMRQEIPNSQIRDAAEQFMSAWKLLEKEPPMSGLLLPLVNTAALTIELYLKCLSSEVIYTPDDEMEGISIVTAEPPKIEGRHSHTLVEIFNKIPEDYQLEINQAYVSEYIDDSREFESVLR